MKVGDRYRCVTDNPTLIVEYRGSDLFLVVENPKGISEPGTIDTIDNLGLTIIDNTKSYKYLGNFAKSYNFSNLYDLLNENP